MASLRDQIAEQLRTRLASISGWTAVRIGKPLVRNQLGVVAGVTILGETKEPHSQLLYACVLRLGIEIVVKQEDADATLDDGNPLRLLDRMVAQAEAVVHATPWPNEEIATLTGHVVQQPENQNLFIAQVTLEVPYRHNWDDPTVYNPGYTP